MARGVFVALCGLALVVATLATAQSQVAPLSETEYRHLFVNFVRDHGKQYGSAAEHDARFALFKQNVDVVRTHNLLSGAPYRMGINQFADMTVEEVAASHLARFVKSEVAVTPAPRMSVNVGDYPDSLDWRQAGVVAPVENQGSTGNSIVFAVADAVTAAWALNQTKVPVPLPALSSQELADCATNMDFEDVYSFVVQNGLCLASAYPPANGTCQSTACPAVASISGFFGVPSGAEDQLLSAVQGGLVTVVVEADSQAFLYYTGGVLNSSSCGTNVNHALTVVGYGTDPAAGPYWIAKNSWGTSWGESGYIRLARGVDECGIAYEPVYPFITPSQ